MLTEGERALHQVAGLAEERIDLPFALHLLAVALDQLGFVVEGIEMADAAAAEYLDHTLGPGRKIERTNGAGRSGARVILAKQAGQSDRPETGDGLGEKGAASHGCVH